MRGDKARLGEREGPGLASQKVSDQAHAELYSRPPPGRDGAVSFPLSSSLKIKGGPVVAQMHEYKYTGKKDKRPERKAQALVENRHDGANPIAEIGKEPSTNQRSHVLVERSASEAGEGS